MITVLPGMGANSKMYGREWVDMSDQLGLHFIDWPPDFSGTSLSELAQAVGDELDYVPDRLIGSSMGGMVALELAQLLHVPQVALIGSTTSSHDIHSILQRLAPLQKMMPLELIRILAGSFASIGPSLLSEMYADQSPDFIRRMIIAVTKWSYTGAAEVFRIHGRNDHIIQCSQADVWIPGGHLIAISHPAECLAAITQWLHD